MSIIQVKNKEDFIEAIKEAGGYNAVAPRVGCSQTMLSMIAKGTRKPNPKVAVNFCAVTKRKFDTIFFIESNDKSNYKNDITN